MPITEENRWKKGRCERVYRYRVSDVARVKGVSVGAVRNDVCRGKVDLGDLGSVVRYCSK